MDHSKYQVLTFKAPSTTAADNSLEYFFIVFFGKIMLDILRESSAWQRIHMKPQALFSSKNKSKKNKSVICCNFTWRFKGLKKFSVHKSDLKARLMVGAGLV